MTRDDIRKLLGGYATDTLTPEEQQALFAAALDDQDLFDALAREQSLRDLLRDPVAKARLLATLDDSTRPLPKPWYRRYTVSLSAAAACAAVLAAFILLRPAPHPPQIPVAVNRNPAANASPETLLAQSEPQASRELRTPGVAARSAKPQAIRKNPRPQAATEGSKAELQAVSPVPAAAPPPPPAITGAVAPPPVAEKDKSTAQSVTVTGEASLLILSGQAGAGGAPSATNGFVPSGGGGGGSRGVRGGNAEPAAQDAVNSSPPPQPQQASPQSPPPQQRQAQARAMAPFAGTLGAISADKVAASPITASAKVLRKQEDGGFTEADPADLHAGDTIKVHVTLNSDGYLTIMETTPGGPTLQRASNVHVERLKPFDTEPFQTNEPGKRELAVLCTRYPQPAKTATPAITYVNSPPGSQQVSVKIMLNYK